MQRASRRPLHAPPHRPARRMGEGEPVPCKPRCDLWRSYLASFMSYTQCDDARQVQKADVIKWKQHLLELGNSAKTINDSKLAALKAIFRWAVDNELLPANPAAGVSVRRTSKKSDMLGFDKQEAATILRAAAKQSNPAYRWVPLLCAQSGARVAEVCQLRGEDIGCEDGIFYMHFRAEAGSLKNRSSERKVPLHPHVLDAGFRSFAQQLRRRTAVLRSQAAAAGSEAAPAEDRGEERRAMDTHAWHRRRAAQAEGSEPRLASPVPYVGVGRGHRREHDRSNHGLCARNVRQSYGEVRLATAAKAIARIPLAGVYQRWGGPGPGRGRG